MPFQNSVARVIPAGLIGEPALHGHLRAQPGRLATANAALNIVGRATTVVDGGTGQPLAGDNGANPHTLDVQVGGAGVFAGIIFHPKVYAQQSLLAAGLGAIPNGTIVELCQETAGLFVVVPEDASVGDWIWFLTADGALVTSAPDAAAPAGANDTPIGRVERYDVATPAGGMTVAYIGPINRAA